VIWHIGTFEPSGSQGLFEKNSLVQCNVDENKRRLFARVHSAGHLLDIAMTMSGRSDLKPSKGYHFASGAYVEYIGEVSEPDRKALVASLNKYAKEIIESTPADKNVFKKICTYDEANKHLEKAGGVPPYIPVGSDLRVLKLTEDDAGCPCGGTHVNHVKDIEEITITKITKKGKAIRVAYTVKGASD
jgi:Ser-tRNA(Ala) deacylase AlaX